MNRVSVNVLNLLRFSEPHYPHGMNGMAKNFGRTSDKFLTIRQFVSIRNSVEFGAVCAEVVDRKEISQNIEPFYAIRADFWPLF